MINNKKVIFRNRGFTIVELLVVIVVIGILAAITIVSYSGISNKVIIASLQSDLSNSANKLKIYQAIYGSYPTSLNIDKCPSAPNIDTNYCLKASANNTFTYASDGMSFLLTDKNANGAIYSITDNSSPQAGSGLNPADWITIGNQTWAKANLNVGTMIAGVADQNNNSIVEKYCYDDIESNCTSYGGLYQWDEVMQYMATEGAKGICPVGSHVPSDNDWQVLELRLGMTQAQVVETSWRGVDQGTQLKLGGSSGMNILLAGNRDSGGSFVNLLSFAILWSSSESGIYAHDRSLLDSLAGVDRNLYGKSSGLSVRCVGN